jgi:hypothetical protein
LTCRSSVPYRPTVWNGRPRRSSRPRRGAENRGYCEVESEGWDEIARFVEVERDIVESLYASEDVEAAHDARIEDGCDDPAIVWECETKKPDAVRRRLKAAIKRARPPSPRKDTT